MSSVPPSSAPAPELQPPDHDARDRNGSPPFRVWMAPVGLLLGFGLGILGSIAVDIVAAVGGSSLTHPTPAATIAADILFDLGFVAAAIYLTTIRGHASAADFGFRRVSPLLGAKAVALAALCYYGVTTVYSSLLLLHGKDKLPSELGATHSTAALVAASIFVCVVAPIAEEFFFRGFLFGTLRTWRIQIAGRDVGTWFAAIVTGLLFGLAHTGSAASQYLVPLAFLGFVLCIVRWKTGSLYPCIALHSANNALALGVNQLSWSAAGIVGLILASWLVVGALTAPLASRTPRAA
jgi:membrane protease YdiL (CAAX protease family)